MLVQWSLGNVNAAPLNAKDPDTFGRTLPDFATVHPPTSLPNPACLMLSLWQGTESHNHIRNMAG